MYRLLLAASLLIISACGAPKAEPETPAQPAATEAAAPQSNQHADTEAEATAFDAELAKKLDADPYGMHQYVMAFLKAGPNRTTDSLEAAKLQAAHMENIGRMAEEGTLVLAGPFLDGGDLRGIYIFDVKTVEEAEALTSTDPAIQAGSLVMELHPWYGSAAVMGINDVHNRISEKKI